MSRMRPVIFGVLAAIILTGCGRNFRLGQYDAGSASTWPYPRGNLASTAAAEAEFSGRLNIKWEAEIPGSPAAPMTLGVGRLIVPGSGKKIHFFDIDNGKYNGKLKVRQVAQTGVVTADSLAYFAIAHHKNELACVNLKNRETLWSAGILDATGTPVILDSLLFIASASGHIHCFNRYDGRPVWHDSVGARSPAGPSAADETVYFPLDDGRLRAYSAENGKLIFETDLEQPLMAKAVIGLNIYLTGLEGGLFAVDIEDGRIIWKKQYPAKIWTAPALDDDILYFGDNGGHLRAVSAADGSDIWDFTEKTLILSSPIIIGDHVIFGTMDKMIYSLNKRDGQITAKRQTAQSISQAPVSDGERVFIVDNGGNIVCLGD